MKNVIVTGATGFLGRNMIRRLCAEGYKVYAVIRPDSKNKDKLPRHENIVPVFCTLAGLQEADDLKQNHFDAFYHFAWGGVNRNEIDDDSVQHQNMVESLAVLKAAAQMDCGCFIFSGSRSEYGMLKGSFREDSECHPIVAYGRAKHEFGERAAEMCKGGDMRYIHARIFSVYGADDHPWSLVYTAVNKMLQNESMDLSSCKQLWDFMDVRDMADLLLTFHQKCDRIPLNDSGVFNVASGDIRPLREYVEEIYRITESHSELRFGAFQQQQESALSILPDMTKVERIFGWKQTIPFSAGIQNMIRTMEGQ